MGSVLNILAGSNGYVEIEGLTDVLIPDVKLAKRLYARGKRARSTSWTNVNEASSRSHWWVLELHYSLMSFLQINFDR